MKKNRALFVENFPVSFTGDRQRLILSKVTRASAVRGMVGTAMIPVLLACALLFSGCNTIEGSGKDIRATGDAISDVAKDTKEEMNE